MTPLGRLSKKICLLALSAALLLMLGLAAHASGLSEQPSIEGEWVTPSGLHLDGTTTAKLDEGAIHAKANGRSAFAATIDAERITVDWSWQQGERVNGMNGGDDIVRVISDDGQESKALHRADLTATRLQAVPEALVLLDEDADGHVEGNGTSQTRTIEDRQVVRAQQPDGTHWAGEEKDQHGFWHAIEGNAVHLEAFDSARIEGTFQVFLNNVTIDAQSDDGSWTHWTGYRSFEEGPITRYESRITVLTVEDGTMTLSLRNGMAGYAPDATVSWEGHARATEAIGELTGLDTRYVFDATSLELDGQGTLELAPHDAPPRSLPADIETAPLSARVDGTFQVTDTPGLEHVPINEVEEQGWGFLAPGILGAFLLMGLVSVSHVPIRRHVDELQATIRERRIHKWMQTGDRLVKVREFKRAHGWYKRITDAYPNHAEGWYSEATCLEELGRHGEAAEAFTEANRLIGGDDPELLDRAGAAAWRADDRDTAIELFISLARIAPDQLRRRSQQDLFTGLMDEPELREVFEKASTDGSYYA